VHVVAEESRKAVLLELFLGVRVNTLVWWSVKMALFFWSLGI